MILIKEHVFASFPVLPFIKLLSEIEKIKIKLFLLPAIKLIPFLFSLFKTFGDKQPGIWFNGRVNRNYLVICKFIEEFIDALIVYRLRYLLAIQICITNNHVEKEKANYEFYKNGHLMIL